MLDVVDIMLATGARIGEALAIRWKDIDLKSEKPTVTDKRDHRRHAKAGPDHPGSPEERQFPPKIFLARLCSGDASEAANWPAGSQSLGCVFPSAVGTLRDPNNFRKQWCTAREELGFGWVTPHTFRKTVGTLLAASGGMAAASAQLGHSSGNVTSKHYVQRMHVAPDNTAILQSFAEISFESGG